MMYFIISLKEKKIPCCPLEKISDVVIFSPGHSIYNWSLYYGLCIVHNFFYYIAFTAVLLIHQLRILHL